MSADGRTGLRTSQELAVSGLLLQFAVFQQYLSPQQGHPGSIDIPNHDCFVALGSRRYYAYAEFSKSGDGRSFWTETIETDDESIALTWYDFVEPYMLRVEAGSNPGRPHGVYSCFVPALKAQITVNGEVARGRAFREMRGDKVSSTACLAWSETWVRP